MKTVKDFEIKTERIVVDGRKYIATDEGNLFIMHDTDADSPFLNYGDDINFLSFDCRQQSYGLGVNMEKWIERTDDYKAIDRLLGMKGFDTIKVDKLEFSGLVFSKKGEYSKEMVQLLIEQHLNYLEGETYLIKIESDGEELSDYYDGDIWLSGFYGLDDLASYLKEEFGFNVKSYDLTEMIIYK